jgi:hypothetical protein
MLAPYWPKPTLFGWIKSTNTAVTRVSHALVLRLWGGVSGMDGLTRYGKERHGETYVAFS